MKSEMMIDRLEQLGGRELTEDERGEIELWQMGRALAQYQHFEGYTVIMDMLQGYVTKAIQQSLSIRPGDDRVSAAHAVAYSLNELFIKLQQDIATAITAARTTPDIVRNGLRSASGTPPDLL